MSVDMCNREPLNNFYHNCKNCYQDI